MARRLLSRDHVHRELKALKCRWMKDYETLSMWETGSGIWFTVPHETPEKRTAQDMLRNVLNDIAQLNVFTGKRPL
jgi:hypothetical protein